MARCQLPEYARYRKASHDTAQLQREAAAARAAQELATATEGTSIEALTTAIEAAEAAGVDVSQAVDRREQLRWEAAAARAVADSSDPA